MAEMGSLEELLEKTEIDFEDSIDNEEAEKLMDYIASKIHSSITYTLSTSANKRIAYVRPTGETKKSEHSSSKINGMIHGKRRDLSFEFIDHTTLPGYGYVRMRFFTPPGYKLQEIPEDEVELMDKVRMQVKTYFSKRK